MFYRFFGGILSCFSLAACQPIQVQEVSHKPVVKEEPVGKINRVTRQDWEGDLKSVAEEKNIKRKEDGTYSFTTRIGVPESGGQVLNLLGVRDEFRRLRHYEDYMSKSSLYSTGVDVGFYLALADYQKPDFFVAPQYFGDDWMFVERIQFMADGDVVLDKSFGHEEVDRNVSSSDGLVRERVDFFLNENELDALRKFQGSKSSLIRVSGRRVYRILSKERTKHIKMGLENLIRSYDALQDALRIPDGGGRV